MGKTQFRVALIRQFPSFGSYWDDEDINSEDNGLLSSLFFFYKAQHLNFEEKTISELPTILEEIVSADPNDESDIANAICTSCLELIDENI